PNWVLSLAGQRVSENPTWVAFAALLLFLLSLFYLPGAGDPYRYPVSAWLGVVCRLPQALFFLWLYPGQYAALGLVHLALFVIQVPLLILVLRAPAPLGTIPEDRVPDDPRPDPFEYSGSTFAEVRAVVFEEPYPELPYHRGLSMATLT